jgi:hypothetical protein
MVARYGFTKNGTAFPGLTVLAVWAKGEAVEGYDPEAWRKDTCGAWMRFDKYGDTASAYAWEIDHEKPLAKGGTDALANLQPLQWQNNRHKADNWPKWSCLVSLN